MNCPHKIKVCTRCKKILIACEINFHKGKKGKYGYVEVCKECKKEQYIIDREEKLKRTKEWYEKNKEKKREYDKEYREKNREKRKEQSKEYNKREDVKERKREKNREYNKREDVKERNKKYRQEHKEEKRIYDKKYRQEHPEKDLNHSIKRRQLKEQWGKDVTNEQLHQMYIFFNGECAYSGIKIKKGINNSIDHIVPLSKGGEHNIWNLVPMDKSYNSSKHTSDMEDWYRQQEYFSEERLAKIYEWCEYAYKKWGVED